MLIKSKALRGHKLNCLDGEIGSVKEFYFDDDFWAIRYLVVDTASWLVGKQVLISPYALISISNETHTISIDLVKQEVYDSPSIENDVPVSKQFEQAYYGYYGWPNYWGGPYMWGGYPYMIPGAIEMTDQSKLEDTWDRNLRSTQALTGYHIQGSDGEIGHISDFVIDDSTWAIRYVVIDTRNWWPGKKVLISPKWIEEISWGQEKVFVQLKCAAIQEAPEYDDSTQLTRDYEILLHKHYEREGYWVKEPAPKALVM